MAEETTLDIYAADLDTFIEDRLKNYLSKNPVKFIDLITTEKAKELRVNLVAAVNDLVKLVNQVRPKGEHLRPISHLPGYAVAEVILSTGAVKKVEMGATGYKIAAKRYYKTPAGDWAWAGTYEIINEEGNNSIMRIFSYLCPDGTRHDEHSMHRYIATNADTVSLHSDNKLIYFRNGVWDFKTKTLTDYNDPDYDSKYGDKITFAKLPVYHPYGKNAVLKADPSGFVKEPEITNPDGTTWRPSSCFEDPFDMSSDVGRACNTIVWQLLHFTIRHMNGSPHLYHFWIDAGGKGHNGKSTLWEIMQRLIKKDYEDGDEDLKASGDTVINCAIENLDKDYVLAENITTAYAIVGEESNAATSYIENCAMIKMLSRAQEYTFRQIRQAPFSFRYEGALVQQLNKPPLFSEKTDSMFTHSVDIMFSNSFDDSRPYIKDDYILREEVAEWLAYHVTVEMGALDAYDSDALKTLEPFKREMLADGLSTMQALDDIVPGLKMNFMPSELLYELYIRWCDKNGINGRAVVSAKVFRDDLEQYGINNTNCVEYTKKYARTSTKDLEQEHPALREFGHSNKSYFSQYVHREASNMVTSNNANIYRGRLAEEHFKDENGKAKVWTKGGLKRLTKWQDMPKRNITAEIDEDAETE